MNEELYTVQEVATRLKMHPESGRRFIRQGRLRAVKIGASTRPKLRVSESDLKEFLSK